MQWTRNVRLRQLEILARLCDAKNLSQVADEFGLTQPALSKWLREFEGQIGAPLFHRHAHGVSPLPAAFELARHTRDISSRLRRAQTSIDQMKALATSHLVIGVSPMTAIVFLPKIVAVFRNECPNTFLQIEEATLDVLIPKLRAGEIDVAMGRVEYDEISPDLNLERLEELTLCLAVCATHPLANQKRVEWSEALKYPWIAPPAASPLRQQLKLAFEMLGIGTAPFMIEASSAAIAARIISDSDLVAPISVSLAIALGLEYRLNVPWPRLSNKAAIGLVWRREDEKFELLQQFLACVRP